MTRRRAEQLMAEAKRLEAQAKMERLREQQIERKEDDHRCRLLGRALTRAMRTDAALRARFAITMQGYCKGARDRGVFRLDAEETWFDGLATLPTDAGKAKAGAAAKPSTSVSQDSPERDSLSGTAKRAGNSPPPVEAQPAR